MGRHKNEKRKIWITTDWHLHHTNLIKHGVRPRNNNQQVIDAAKRVLGGPRYTQGHILINLGDLGGTGPLTLQYLNQYISAMGCTHILTPGNHDQQSIFGLLDLGFDAVVDTFTIRKYGFTWLFSHRPQVVTDSDTINIHGHLHLGAHRDEEWKEVEAASRPNAHRLIALEVDGFDWINLATIYKEFR